VSRVDVTGGFVAVLQVRQRDGDPPVGGGRHRRAEEAHRRHQHDPDQHRERDRSRRGGAGLPQEEPREREFPEGIARSSFLLSERAAERLSCRR